MNRYRYFAASAYLVAATLIIIPFFDAGMSLWPWRPSSAQWRFGAIGLMSNALMLPCAGLLIALAAGVALGHYRGLRILGFVCLIAAVLVGLQIPLFALDAMQTRANVNPAARLSFNVASATAVVKLLVATVTLAAFSRAARQSSKDRRYTQTQSPVRQPLAT